MGDYLELSIPLSNEGSLGAALAPVFRGSYFRPVAVGALEGHTSGDHWFIAGYALEEFLSYWLESRIPPPASITVFTSEDAELNMYHQQCADALKRTTPLELLRSPFEQVDAQLGVTVLEPKRLPEGVLVSLTEWANQFRRSAIYVYGDIDLALQKPAGSSWKRAFQHVRLTGGESFAWAAPFLILQLYTADPHVGRQIVLRTQAHVWLSQAQALGGLVTPEDADTNLKKLASFARTLTQGKRGGTHTVELSLEGSFFTREEARIRAAFQDLL